jgi:hypothetical protein
MEVRRRAAYAATGVNCGRERRQGMTAVQLKRKIRNCASAALKDRVAK